MRLSRRLSVELNPAALELARDLRRAGLRVELGDGGFRLKKSFEIGNKLARKIVLLGEDEMQSGILTVKDFASGEQTEGGAGRARAGVARNFANNQALLGF